MRALFKSFTITDWVLFITCLVCGVFFRVAYLDVQSPWNDELGTWFYIRNMDLMYVQEQNTPFYYYVLKLILGSEPSLLGIRGFSAGLSVFHLLVCFFLGQKVFDREKLIFFWVLVCLNPLDIALARQARHYAWFLECILFFWLWLKIGAPIWWLSILSFMHGFIHIFSLFPMAIMLWLERPKKWWLPILTSCGAFFYFIFKEKFIERISWNEDTKFLDFFLRVTQLLLGDTYPRNGFESVGVVGPIFFGVLVAYFLWKRSRGGILFLLSLLVALLSIEMAQFLANWRVERYLAFLPALAIIGLCDSFQRPRALVAFVCCLTLLNWHSPLANFPWVDQWVQNWRTQSAIHKDVEFLVCQNQFHRAYYKIPGPHCREAITPQHTQKSLLLLDLDGHGGMVSAILNEHMHGAAISERVYFFQPRSP